MTVDTDPQEQQPITHEELAEILATPAAIVNKIYLTMMPAGAKLTFCELQAETKRVSARASVFLQYQDLVSLHALIGTQLGNLEVVPPGGATNAATSQVTGG